jgi:hypothetical protein
MRAALALLCVLSIAMISGCQSAETPAQTTKTTQTAQTETAAGTTKSIADPITITPDPSSLGSKVSAKGGISKNEAQIAGAEGLIALRKDKLGDSFGTSSEEYTLLNQVQVMGEWLLTYSRTTVNKAPADAYAATIVLDSKTGKQLRVTEAP